MNTRGKRVLSLVLALCLCVALLPTIANAVSPTYSRYDGVDFTNANISTQRKTALTKAMQMVYVTWTCPADFPTWRAGTSGILNTVISTDGTKSQKFIKGKTYTGIPYCMIAGRNRYDDITWTSDLSNGTITTKYMTCTRNGGDCIAYGSDCSAFVYLALKAANAGPIEHLGTASMLTSAYYSRISWDTLKPADLFLKHGHVMMYVGMNGSKYAVFECDASDAKCSYNEYTKSELSSYNCYRFNGFDEGDGGDPQPPVPPARQHDSRFSGWLPIHSYAMSTEKIAVYDAYGTKYDGNARYINGSTDECIIQEIYTDGWCKVKYPSSVEPSGYFTAYVKLTEFISNVSLTNWTASGAVDAYRRSSGTATIGSVSAGDKCLKVNSANGRIQVIYPVTGKGYYKMGWIGQEPVTPPPGPSPAPAPNYLLPCYSYTISTGKVTVYDSSHNPYPTNKRYIDGAKDRCIIREIYTDGWCYVSYPSSAEADGWFEAYVPLSEFISNPNIVYWTANGGYDAYRRSNGTETIGSITSGDTCVVVSEANGRMQVMYPVTGENYYKMGWINTSLANNPQGTVDEISGGLYSVRVRGWAFDKDDLNAALKIHVYIGGVGYEITANAERPDVHNAHGCGNYHGFDATINVGSNLTGKQKVEVYAINVGSGTNIPLGVAEVNIGSDTTAPVISDVKVTDISPDGYTVTCKVTDANGVDRVQFPTWTSHNGQDDLFEAWPENSAASGTKNGDTYTYRVQISAHNYEGGEYTTHIYAYDKYGNQAKYDVPVVQVPVDVMAVTFDVQEHTFEKIGEELILTTHVYPENATDQKLTWSSSDTSVATVSNGVVTAVGVGTAVIKATTSNGAFAMCTITVAEATLESISIATNPTKTTYYVGDTLDTTGLILKASYSDGSTQTITEGFTCTPTELTAVGTQTITVSYGGKTTTFSVTVSEVTLTKISMKKHPKKTTYYVGDAFDPTGIELTATYSDGSTKVITEGFICTPDVLTTAGVQKITVYYGGITTAFTVTVSEVTLTELRIATNPTKTVYEIGEALDTTGLTLRATYSDGSTKTITTGFTVSGFSSATAGEKTVTVTYEGFTVTFTVTVRESHVVDPNAPKLVVQKTEAVAGETVTVTLDLSNSPSFGGMAYDVYFDTNMLELVSYELNLGSAICTDSGIDTYPGRINFQYASTENVSGDGTLVTFTFKVKEDVKTGFTPITVIPEEGTSFYYDGRKEIDFDLFAVDGGIEIIDYMKGDINGDGKVNNRDAARLMQYLAGWDVDYVEAALDVNGDGKVNNRDAARLMQYLAGWEVEIH